MRTTLDLPDDLMRSAKARAALRAMKLSELVAEAIAAALESPPGGTHNYILPDFPKASRGSRIPSRTNAELENELQFNS